MRPHAQSSSDVVGGRREGGVTLIIYFIQLAATSYAWYAMSQISRASFLRLYNHDNIVFVLILIFVDNNRV